MESDRQARPFRIGQPIGGDVARQLLQESGDADDFLSGAIDILQVMEMRRARRCRIRTPAGRRRVAPSPAFAATLRSSSVTRQSVVAMGDNRVFSCFFFDTASGSAFTRSEQLDLAAAAARRRLDDLDFVDAGARRDVALPGAARDRPILKPTALLSAEILADQLDPFVSSGTARRIPRSSGRCRTGRASSAPRRTASPRAGRGARPVS